MPDKPVIYNKKYGEPPVPITVRIEWLPDGTIKPLMYRTPDGACYEVKHTYEMKQLAFLKERGVGIRFKVKAELTETADSDDELLNSRHETYLYLTDNRFCGKNFIDSRYGHAGKEYIAVTLDVFPDCDYELVCFTVQGKRYMVEKTIAIEPRGSFNAGGIGVWHKVEARLVDTDTDDEDDNEDDNNGKHRIAAVYFEVNKWWVSKVV